MSRKEKTKKAPSYHHYMSTKEVVAYSLGLFGFQAIFGYINSYQAEFGSTVLGVNLAVIGVMVLVAKVLSAAFDPVVGKWIDKTTDKRGKFKPMILKSLIPFLIMTVVLFINVPFKSHRIAVYIWIFVTYLLWTLAFTMGDVPSQGIASVLTPEPAERTDILSIANTAKQIGFSACYVIVPIACLIIPAGSKVFVKTGEQDTPMIPSEYLFTAILTGVLGCLLLALIPLWNKERVPYKAGQTYTMKEMFAALKDNKNLMLVIFSYFLGFGRQTQMAIQVQTSNALLGSQNLVALLGITTAVGSVVSMVACPFLIKKWGEKKVFLGLSYYGFAACILSYVCGHFWFLNPGSVGLTILFYLFMFLVGLTTCTFTIMPMIMTADSIDYYEYKTGKRMEGASYALLTLSIKICLALSAAVGLLFVGLSGYDDTTRAIAAGAASSFSLHTKDVVFFAYRMVPGITTLLAAFPIIKYSIDSKTKKEIGVELQKRRAAAAEDTDHKPEA